MKKPPRSDIGKDMKDARINGIMRLTILQTGIKSNHSIEFDIGRIYNSGRIYSSARLLGH